MTNKQVKLLTFFIVAIISLVSVFILYSAPGNSGGMHYRSGMFINYDTKTGCYYLEGTAGAKTPLLDQSKAECIKKISKDIFVQRFSK